MLRLLTGVLASALLLAPAAADAAVQFPLAPHFNADIVASADDLGDVSFDNSNTIYGTDSGIAAAGCATPVGLPDDGVIPATSLGPRAELAFGEGRSGPNAWFKTAADPNDTPGIDVPDGSYGSVHVFAASSEGDAPLKVSLGYAEGAPVQENLTVLDWFTAPDNVNPPSYARGDNMDRLTYDGTDGVFGAPCGDHSGGEPNPALFGIRVEADETRVLQSIAIEHSAAGGRLAVFGLVGEAELLTVAKTGGAGGTVTGDGIDCGAGCSHAYFTAAPPAESVTLTATPEANASFAGWSGACTGTGTCSVTMDDARAVSAQFEPINHELTVARTGDGAGVVTSSPAGIDCGADCSELLRQGSTITLTPAAAPGSQFVRWEGACTGTTFECVVKMDNPRSVIARFGAVIADDFGLPRDVLAPTVTATVPRRMRRRALRRGIPVTVTCSEACRVEAVARRGSRRLGRITVTAQARLRTTVRIRLSAQVRRLLRRGRRRISVRITATDAAGNPSAPVSRSVRLRR